jgi:hypothetical protein
MKKSPVDLRGKPKHPNGSEIGDESLGQLAGTALAQATDGPAVKLYCIAQELFQKGIVELDEADLRVLKTAIEKTPILPVLTKAPILMKIESALDKAKDGGNS